MRCTRAPTGGANRDVVRKGPPLPNSDIAELNYFYCTTDAVSRGNGDDPQPHQVPDVQSGNVWLEISATSNTGAYSARSAECQRHCVVPSRREGGGPARMGVARPRVVDAVTDS